MSKTRKRLLIKLKWLPALHGNTVLPSQQPGSWFPAYKGQITLLLLSKTTPSVCVCVRAAYPSFSAASRPLHRWTRTSVGKYTNSSCYPGSLRWPAGKQKHCHAEALTAPPVRCSWTAVRDLRWETLAYDAGWRPAQRLSSRLSAAEQLLWSLHTCVCVCVYVHKCLCDNWQG